MQRGPVAVRGGQEAPAPPAARHRALAARQRDDRVPVGGAVLGHRRAAVDHADPAARAGRGHRGRVSWPCCWPRCRGCGRGPGAVSAGRGLPGAPRAVRRSTAAVHGQVSQARQSKPGNSGRWIGPAAHGPSAQPPFPSAPFPPDPSGVPGGSVPSAERCRAADATRSGPGGGSAAGRAAAAADASGPRCRPLAPPAAPGRGAVPAAGAPALTARPLSRAAPPCHVMPGLRGSGRSVIAIATGAPWL